MAPRYLSRATLERPDAASARLTITRDGHPARHLHASVEFGLLEHQHVESHIILAISTLDGVRRLPEHLDGS
jgi:hypothetical protein